MTTFNTLAITNAAHRLCENLACNHLLENHAKGNCTECDCKEFKKNPLRICIKNEGISYTFPNFIERKCPFCGVRTHMVSSMVDQEDGFVSFSLSKSKWGSEIKTACHSCDNCGLVSFYKITSTFDSLLRKLLLNARYQKQLG